MTCEYCGNEFEGLYKKQRFCRRECSAKYWQDQRRDQEKSPYLPVERHQRRPKQLIETDADQARLKRLIDDRHSIGHDPGITIKRGSKEWKEIEKTVTPPGQIRNGTSCYGWLYAAYWGGR